MHFAHVARHVQLFYDPMDWSLPGSTVRGISLARIPEWVPISFSRWSWWSRDETCVSCISGGLFTTEPPVQSVQFSSVTQSCLTLWDPMNHTTQASLSTTNSRSSLKLMSIELVMPSSHLILCRPLLLLPPIPPSIRVFSNESAVRMRWPKYWSFSFGISPSYEHPELISFRMDWLDLLAVKGTLKSLLQHHSSKA